MDKEQLSSRLEKSQETVNSKLQLITTLQNALESERKTNQAQQQKLRDEFQQQASKVSDYCKSKMKKEEQKNKRMKKTKEEAKSCV